MAIAKAIVAGRLTASPECSYLPSGKAVCNFTVAVDDGWGSKEHTSFVQCNAFEKVAETLCQYKTKGDMILVDGTLFQEEWEKDGKRHTRMKVKAWKIDFLGRSQQRDEQGRFESAENTFPPKGSGANDQAVDPETGENLPF